MGMAGKGRRQVEITEQTVRAVDEFAESYHIRLSRNQAAELLIRHALKEFGIDAANPPKPPAAEE